MPPRRPNPLLLVPLWLVLAVAGCQVTPKGPPGELLAEARKRFEAKDWNKAALYGDAVRQRHPDSPEAEEATYLAADSHRRLLRAQRSFSAYESFADKYPSSRFSVEAAVTEFDLGRDQIDGKFPGFLFFGPNREGGVRVLEHMQLHYKNHSLADDALMRIADWHMQTEEYEDAAEVLRRLLADYPRSSFTMRARFQLARALWLQCQGPDYDERVLMQARRGFEDFVGTARLANLEEELAEQITAAQKMIATIQETLSIKYYRIGRFYERTGHPEAAVRYYQETVTRFVGTRGAADSNRRLVELGRAPPEPTAG